jgi:dihydroorotase
MVADLDVELDHRKLAAIGGDGGRQQFVGKRLAAGDRNDAAPGFPGVETSMRLMLNEVGKGRLSLPDYVRMACEAPARAFGLYPRKGALQPGSDADIVVVDLARSGVIRGADLHSMADVTPFEGWRTTGLPVMTVLRGAVVAHDGRLVAQPGIGRSVAHAARDRS